VAEEQNPRERSFISQLVPDWQPTSKQKLWVVRIVIVLVALLSVLALIGLPFGITLWDWAGLLIVPAVLAIGGVWFSQRQELNRDRSADRRAQDDALEAYLDDMTNLMIDYHLRAPPQGEDEDPIDVRAVARARTLTLLRRLDGKRKGHVVQFLYESDLMTKGTQGTPAVDLGQMVRKPLGQAAERPEYGADLSGAILNEAILSGAALSGADLSRAKLREANLHGADLIGANLMRADLSKANLSEAGLQEANLHGADLRGAKLNNALLYAPMYSGPVDATAADLRGADLRGADLTDAQVAPEQLDQVAFLKGATMPDGQKKGGGEAGDNE
jgi:hypothetical protein